MSRERLLVVYAACEKVTLGIENAELTFPKGRLAFGKQACPLKNLTGKLEFLSEESKNLSEESKFLTEVFEISGGRMPTLCPYPGTTPALDIIAACNASHGRGKGIH